MWVRVLGSAAGGGFPQWNCSCPCCCAVRTGARPTQPRSQSSIAVSADRERWFLFNASPDVAAQIEAFPALHPADGRVVRLEAVLLTDAELDHTLGLLTLREGRGLEVHATTAMHETLMTGTGLLATLEAYCPVTWRRVVPGVDVALGESLTYRAFDVPTDKVVRFPGASHEGRVVGYRVSETTSGGSLVYLPSVQHLTGDVLTEISDSSCLLVDGTCWSDDEMPGLRLADKTSRDMGHVPIDGADGSLETLAGLPVGRVVYTHVNNTNPILLEDSPERRRVQDHHVEVAQDGLEIEIPGAHR